MFSKIRIKNFKAWDDQQIAEGVELRPVTLLLGTNSSGKTSLLQPFRLMQQTVTSSDPTLQLNLGGQSTDLVDLGSWSEVIHGHDENRNLHLGFDLVHNNGTTEVDLEYGLDTFERVVVQSLSYRRDGERYSAIRSTRGGYSLEAPNFEHPNRPSADTPDAKRAYEPVRSLAFSPEAMLLLGPRLADAVGTLSLTMFRQFEKISYLGPLRALPRRTEQWNQQRPGSLGPNGSGAIRALLASANDRSNSDELIDQISKWLHKMGAADKLEVQRLGASTHYEVRVVRAGLDCNLLDVGFGISQVLPVLTLAYFAPEDSTVIIEEPEIHLHPLAQRLLADLFVEVSRERRIQFLIETHSEHLFRRLQFLIADQQVEADRCRLYFVQRAQGDGAKLRRLEVDTYGRIANWPEKFFGDAIGETEEQMRRMMERMISTAEETA
jgi:hypothetical protein